MWNLFFTPKTRKNPQVLLPPLRRILVPTLTSSGDQGSSEEFLLYKNNLKNYTDILDRMTHTDKKRLQKGVMMSVAIIFFHEDLALILVTLFHFPQVSMETMNHIARWWWIIALLATSACIASCFAVSSKFSSNFLKVSETKTLHPLDISTKCCVCCTSWGIFNILCNLQSLHHT